MKRCIAETIFDYVDPEGTRVTVVARIGEPIMVPQEGELAEYGECPVSLEPLLSAKNIGGYDRLQALCLAIDFLRQVLKSLVAKRGQIFFPGTDAPVDLDSPSFVPSSGVP